MKKMLLIPLLIAGGLLFAGGRQEARAPVYVAAKLDAAAFRLDGAPDEAVWLGAAALDAFAYPWETLPAPATVFRAFH
ncbi:MAG: hypothetical protein LBQ35_09805, partial [Spirochaetaceae bacterium]|nr:hypothetical protein [Spirochaetaceae bacterium]